MRVLLASVSPRGSRSKLAATDTIVEEYLGRLANGAGRWMEASARVFPTSQALLEAAESGKVRPVIVLLDSRGRAMSSEQFGEWLGARRDSGIQEVWLAVGPADGWPTDFLPRADLRLSLGPMTMAHELARAVVAEQLYRGWAIVDRHPYHRGH